MNRIDVGNGRSASRPRVFIAVVDDEPVYIDSDQPVTEDQVRAKLQSEGWAAVEVKRNDGKSGR